MANFKGHPNYEYERVPTRESFGVRHYAGLVIYDASSFLEKNRDTVPYELLDVFSSSVFDIMQELFDGRDKRPSREDNNTAKRKVPTVASSFKVRHPALGVGRE